MACPKEWCEDKISKLLNEEQRISTLNEIKDHLSTIPQDEASRTAKVLQLPLVFDCLNDSNTEQIELACEVLTACLSKLSLGESTNRYGVSLERALNHPLPAVKIMALQEILRSTSREQCLVDLCKQTSLLNTIIKCIGDEDLPVAKQASNVINAVGVSNLGINYLLNADVVMSLHGVMGFNEVVRLRVYEIIINISKESHRSQKLLESAGFLEPIISELNSADVLLKVNIIELLSQFVITKQGYAYLEGLGVMAKLFDQFNSSSDSVFAQLCEPGMYGYNMKATGIK